MQLRSRELVAVVSSLLLLAGATADRISLLPPQDAAEYHRRVRAAAAAVSLNFGDWEGHNVPVPVEAAVQLRPNVIISRTYANRVSGLQVGFLLVQCGDVRDLVPHYPPVCYPGRGLTLAAAEQRDWRAGDLPFGGTEYQFESSTLQSNKLVVVEDFMVLPDGRICREMKEVRRQAGLRTRYFGAAQVQLVISSDVPVRQRAEVCQEFITAYLPLLQTIRSGVRS